MFLFATPITEFPVVSITGSELRATVPAGVLPGSYLLLLFASATQYGVFTVTLGAVGPPGPQGETGATGATGAQGPQGQTGPAGSLGAFEQLSGLPCTRAGTAGQISLFYAGNGDATLRCVLPPTGDSYEPNDSAAQARFLASREADRVTGPFCTNNESPTFLAVQPNFFPESDTSDWFSAEAVENSNCPGFRFGAALSNFPFGNYEIFLLPHGEPEPGRSRFRRVLLGRRSGADDTAIFFIEVRRVFGAATGAPYTLTLQWR